MNGRSRSPARRHMPGVARAPALISRCRAPNSRRQIPDSPQQSSPAGYRCRARHRSRRRRGRRQRGGQSSGQHDPPERRMHIRAADRARVSRTASCSRSGFTMQYPAKRRHSASSVGTAASSERETIPEHRASTSDGPAFVTSSSSSLSVSVSTGKAADEAIGFGTRRGVTLPRSANRSSWPDPASRSGRRGPGCGGSEPVSDGFIVEHWRG